MNTLDGIDVFVKVVQTGSFSGAARLLQMPVTTVSGKVASLEKRLGVTLIHRTTRKLSITQAGEAYFQHCVRALDEVSAAEKALLTSKTEPEGLLRVTAPADFGHLVLPDIVRRYLQTYPKTRVELILTNRVVDLVGEGVDLAIRAGNLRDSTLVARKFMDSEISIFASSAYIKKNGMPKHPRELDEHAFVAFRPLLSQMRVSNGRARFEPQVQARIVVDDFEAMKVFIMGGDGIGVLPPHSCQAELASGKLVPVLKDWKIEFENGTRGQLSFVYPPQRYVSPKIQAFIEMATRSCTSSKHSS